MSHDDGLARGECVLCTSTMQHGTEHRGMEYRGTVEGIAVLEELAAVKAEKDKDKVIEVTKDDS